MTYYIKKLARVDFFLRFFCDIICIWEPTKNMLKFVGKYIESPALWCVQNILDWNNICKIQVSRYLLLLYRRCIKMFGRKIHFRRNIFSILSFIIILILCIYFFVTYLSNNDQPTIERPEFCNAAIIQQHYMNNER